MKRRPPRGYSTKGIVSGDPFTGQDLRKQWHIRANILSINAETMTCDVETEHQGVLTGLAFPCLVRDPGDAGGSIYVPRSGQRVLVLMGLGLPLITQIIPESTDIATYTDPPYTTGESPQRPVFPGADVANYRGQLPSDLVPGDRLWIGSQGQHVGVFDGGAAVLHASPWSQVVCTQDEDTTSVVGRNMNLFSGFGQITFRDTGGSQSMEILGGTSQKTETGYGVERWTYVYRVGGDAEGLVDFRVNDRSGAAVYKDIIQPGGRRSVKSSGAVSFDHAGGLSARYGTSRTVIVGKGDDTLIVQNGNRTEKYAGGVTTRVSQNKVCVVLNDRTDAINRDWSMSIGRNANLAASGNMLAKPGDVAFGLAVNNGDLKFDIGTPGADLGKSQSGMKVNVLAPGGNVEMSTISGKHIFNTTLNDSVLLGATQGVAPFHAAKYEQLEALLNSLLSWADSHVHPTGMGPSGTPTPPASPVVQPLIQPIKSLRVTIGA